MLVGGDEAGRGTVLAESDVDSDSDDDDNDNNKDVKALLERAQRRSRQTKLHGTVRVIWSDSDVRRHRVGQEGHVDVWCIDTAPGGQYYREHLAVLDCELMATGGRSLAAGDDDDEDDDDDDDVGAAAAGASSIRTPLGNSVSSLLLSF